MGTKMNKCKSIAEEIVIKDYYLKPEKDNSSYI